MKKNEKNNDYKFILIGDSSVGKTSIFKKITTEIFNEKNISTIGMDKRTLRFKDVDIKINDVSKKLDFNVVLFDTAGQERYRAITKTYFTGSDGVILIYDITNKKTFQNVESWLKSISEVIASMDTGHYIITLLGNKKDIVESGAKDREVEEDEAEQLCSEKKIYWGGEYSAKESTPEELKNMLIKTWKYYVDKFGIKEEISGQRRMEGSKYKKKSAKKNSFC